MHRGSEPVWGAIVARQFTEDVIDAVGASTFSIALFKFAGSPASVNVECVALSWPVWFPALSDRRRQQ